MMYDKDEIKLHCNLVGSWNKTLLKRRYPQTYALLAPVDLHA